MGNFIKDLESNEAGRKAQAERIMGYIQRAKRNAQQLELPTKFQQDEAYYNWRNEIKGVKYNEFRYNKTFEDIETFLPLLTNNRPKYSFLPREPLDYALVEVIKQVNDWLLEQANFDFHYKMCMKDTLKFGTGFLMPMVTKKKGKHVYSLEVPSVVEMYLGDLTEYDMWRQPYWGRNVIIPCSEAKKRWPDMMDKFKPGDGSSYLQVMEKVWENFKDLVMGFSHDGNDMFTEAEKQWQNGDGRVVGIEYWEKRDDNIYRGYIINGILAEYNKVPWPEYPIAKFTQYPQNKSAIGMSVTDINKGYSDAITSFVQLLLRYFRTTVGGVYLLPKGAGISKETFEEVIRDGFSVIPVPDRYLNMAEKAFRMITPPQIPSGVIEGVGFLRDLGDRQGGQTNYLAGANVSGDDSGVKVARMRQAGMGRLELQAQFNDQDGMYKMGVLNKWYIQNMMDENTVLRVANETYPDGQPKFIDIQLVVTAEMMKQGLQQANAGGDVQAGVTTFTPEEFKQQYELLEKRVEEEALKTGAVPKYKLNDISVGEFDISVQDSDVLPFNEEERKKVLQIGIDAGTASAKEWRKAFKLPIDPKSMSEIPATVQVPPIEDIMKQLEENPEGTPGHAQVMQQLVQAYAQMYPVATV